MNNMCANVLQLILSLSDTRECKSDVTQPVRVVVVSETGLSKISKHRVSKGFGALHLSMRSNDVM